MGFYNKVVLDCHLNCNKNAISLNGYQWNLTQLITHEMVHCMQFHRFGFWNSNPVANISNWKWEGYAEYIARQNPDQKNHSVNLYLFQNTSSDEWGIAFKDNTIAPRDYYNTWNFVQFCIEQKKLSYIQLLEDTTSQIVLEDQISNWHKAHPN
jgi:hypothetical protein